MARAQSPKIDSPPYRLFLFGGFQLVRNGEPIELYSHKVESLLAFLALHSGEHSREKLAALLWGDSTDEQARGSLRRALNDLRKKLGADAILTDRESAQLSPAFPLWVDASEFRRMTEDERRTPTDQAVVSGLLSSVALYAGDLLADFYDEWIFPLREEYRELYLGALSRLIEHHRTQGEYQHAIELARKMLATDAANETAHQHLIFCYSARGERTAALEQFEKCARALRQELGIEPSQETVALYENIKQKRLTGSTAARLTNLPKPTTSFVGRQEQLQDVIRLLREAERIVTLTGAGGSGKTRLAIQVAEQLIDDYVDGVWWVDLAALQQVELVPQQVAKTLAIQEQPPRTWTETLVEFLRDKQVLLVIDNCEHLLAACARLAQQLTAQVSSLGILNTSREALKIPGEYIYPVTPLTTPPKQETQFALDALRAFEAVHLFSERVRARQPAFRLSEQNAPYVVRICQQLDGIPLALELAAPQIKTYSLEEIAARLEQHRELMDAARAHTRHQTLQALMDWSYELLSPAAQVLFCRLAVFAGGWTMQAATAIAGGYVDTDAELVSNRSNDLSGLPIRAGFVMQALLHQLVDKSLLQIQNVENEMRFTMLETIREYARDKLNLSEEAELVRSAHLNYFLKLAEEVEPQLRGREQAIWQRRMEMEHDNFRAALTWCLGQHDAHAALKLAGALYWFWSPRGYLGEGRRWLEQALAVPGAADYPALCAHVWFAAGAMAWLQSEFEIAYEQLSTSVTLWRQLGNLEGQGLALTFLGMVVMRQGDYARARAIQNKSVSVLRQSGDAWRLAMALNDLGHILRESDEPALAEAVYEEGLKKFREAGDVTGIALSLDSLARLAVKQGDYATGQALHEQSLPTRRALDNQRALADLLYNLGEATRGLGDDLRAEQYYTESLALYRKFGSKYMSAWLLNNLSFVALHKRDFAQARMLLGESARLFLEPPVPAGLACCLVGYAGIAAADNKLELGVSLLGAAEAQLKHSRFVLDAVDDRERESITLALQNRISEEKFLDAWNEGQCWTMEQALANSLAT